MLVSHSKKFIFTKTTKTAGTSLESYFERFCMPPGTWEFSHYRDETVSDCGIVGYRGMDSTGTTFRNHMTALQIKDAIGSDIWEEYFKFTIIRNPFDKLVSAFYHFEKFRNSDKYNNKGESDIVSFRKWVAAGRTGVDRSAYLIDGQISVDYFIRYESLLEGLKNVCDRLDVAFEPECLPHLKSEFRDRHHTTAEFYDSKTQSLVRQAYEFELDCFGYDLPQHL